jgi:hypothetical protein
MEMLTLTKIDNLDARCVACRPRSLLIKASAVFPETTYL